MSSTQVKSVKKQLTEEQIQMKAEETRVKNVERTRKWRAKQRAAKGAAPAKKKVIKQEVAAPKNVKKCDAFPEELMVLYREARRLERNGQSDKITEEMKIARKMINKMYLSLQAGDKKQEASPKPDMSLANVPVAPCSFAPKQTALDDLAAQYASDSEDDEIFNTNWRPTPAPRRL